MDIDSVQLEVKNEEGVAPAPVRRGNVVAIIIEKRSNCGSLN